MKRKLKRKLLVFMSICVLFVSNIAVYASDYDNDSDEGLNYESTTDDCDEETITLKELVEQGVTFTSLDEYYSINSYGGLGRTLSPGESGLSSGIKLSKGDSINITSLADPNNKSYQIGILQPNGVIRCVTGTGPMAHTFSITQNGTHKVYVYNNSDTTIDVVVGYSY